MKKLLAALLLPCLVLLAACGKQNPPPAARQGGYEITDSRQTVVHFPDKPQRIVASGMNLEGIILGLVPKERLAAINALADDPATSNLVSYAKAIPRKIRHPSAEELFSLRPDVFFADSFVSPEIIAVLRDLKINVVVVDYPANIREVKENIRLVAAALGEKEKGERLIAKMDAELGAIAAKVQATKKGEPRKALLISLMATNGGRGSMFDDLCRYAGVINGAGEAGLKVGQPLTKEMIVGIDPDFFVLPTYSNHGEVDIEKRNAEFFDDPALKSLKAVQNKAFFSPRECFLYIYSQDIVYGAAEIAHAAYGDAIARPKNEHITVVE